jgi:hypothetical protein
MDCSLNKMLKGPFNNFRRLKQHASRFMPILHVNFENVSKKEKYSAVNKESNLHITNSIYSQKGQNIQ